MTAILFKLAVFASLLTTIVGVITIMPDAGPLPSAIQDLLTWVLPLLYFIDPIFPIDTFFQVTIFVINSYLTFLTLVGIKKLINTSISAAS